MLFTFHPGAFKLPTFLSQDQPTNQLSARSCDAQKWRDIYWVLVIDFFKNYRTIDG
jgi:hypothetical protein